MIKSPLPARFAANEEQKILFAHLLDLQSRAENRNILQCGNFLSEADWRTAETMLRAAGAGNFLFTGGYDDAERRCPVFLPDYLTAEEIEAQPALAEICFAQITTGKYDADALFSHRDCLGALMALGIERETVGDILPDRGGAVILLKTDIADYVAQNLLEIGRHTVSVTILETPPELRKEELTEATDTVASMRLDAVAAAVFNLSRGNASEAISRGIVSVNGIVSTKADLTVGEGDKIALRGKGRVILGAVDGTSKKGRIRFHYKK